MLATTLLAPGLKPRQPTSGENAVPISMCLASPLDNCAFTCKAPVGRSLAFVTVKTIVGASVASVPLSAITIHPAAATFTLTALATSSDGPLAETARLETATTTIAHRRINDRRGRPA